MCNNEALKGIWFSFEIKAEEYVAFISTQALLVHFHAAGTDKQHLRRAYRKHRASIDAMAIERFHGHVSRPIKLGVSDFRCQESCPRSSLGRGGLAVP
jgi:hypothetical protein